MLLGDHSTRLRGKRFSVTEGCFRKAFHSSLLGAVRFVSCADPPHEWGAYIPGALRSDRSSRGGTLRRGCCLRQPVPCWYFVLDRTTRYKKKERKKEKKLNNFTAGPIWFVPITIIRPKPVTSPTLFLGTLHFEPGTLHRHFLSFPSSFTNVEVKVKGTWFSAFLQSFQYERVRAGGDIDTSRRYVVHCHEIVPHKSFRHTHTTKYITLNKDQEEIVTFRSQGTTLEICLAQFWSRYALVILRLDPSCCE